MSAARWALRIRSIARPCIRAAGGIFYGYFFGDLDTEDGEQFPFIVRNQTPTYTAPPTSGAPPLTIANPKATSAVPTPFIFASLPNRKLPSSYQFNVFLQREFSRSMSLSVGYVGVLGRHLEARSEYCCYYNMPQPWGVVLAPGQRQVQPDPRFSANMLVWEDLDSSNYNALANEIRTPLCRGTWIHGVLHLGEIVDDHQLDRRSALPATAADRRRSAPQSGPLAHLADPGRQRPSFPDTGGVTNQVLGGWQVTTIMSARSGYPFTPLLSGVNLLNMTKLVASLNLPDANCSGKMSNPSALNWYDKSCFVTPVEPTTPAHNCGMVISASIRCADRKASPWTSA